jgi:hypothetical protein
MKSLKFLSIACLFMATAFTASSQMLYTKTTSGKFIAVGKQKTLTTTDATATVMDTLAITNNTAGVIEVRVVGVAATGDAITGKLIYRYKKVSGTLTIGTADAASVLTTDTALSGGTFALAVNTYNNAKLTVTGKAAVSVVWRSRITPF